MNLAYHGDDDEHSLPWRGGREREFGVDPNFLKYVIAG